MSIEAFTYAKFTDIGEAECPALRLLLYVIAENTFNDSGLCRVGHDELGHQMRMHKRSVQRHLTTLAKLKLIEIERRGVRTAKSKGGRQTDAIRLLGFREWLVDQRGKR